MTDWLDDFESQYRGRTRGDKTAEEVQRHKANVLKAKARETLESITARVTAVVQRYQQRFADLPERTVTHTIVPSGGFKLDKAHYPAAYVEVTLKGDDRIEATYGFVQSPQSAPRTQTVAFSLVVNANDEIEVTTADRALASHDDIAKYLVESVLTA